MYLSKKSIAAILLFSLIISLAGEEKVLTVIQTADLHGYVSKNRIFRTAELIRLETEKNGSVNSTVRIDCGDLIQGSYAMTFDLWRTAMFRILSRLHFEVFVPGNHDLEFGVDSLEKSLGSFRGTCCAANWQWKGLPAKKDYVILHKNGLKVAVIGLGYHAVYGVLRPGDKGKVYSLPVRRVMQRVIPRVMQEKPHIIILALHAGEYTRLDKNYTVRHLVREFPQIDLVLTAHSHQECKGAPLWNNTCRIQSPPLAKGIAVATLTYDTEKKAVTSVKTKLVHVNGDTPLHRDLHREMFALDRIVKRSGRKVLGRVSGRLEPLRRGFHANTLTRLCGKSIALSTGSAIVFYTPGSRFRKEAGPLNENELFLLLPYEEYVGTMELDSHECRQVLAEQLKYQHRKEFQSPYGFSYRTRRTRVLSMTLPENSSSGKWKCAFSSYALSGGGGRFPVLRRLAQKKSVKYHPVKIRDLVRSYIVFNGTIRE